MVYTTVEEVKIVKIFFIIKMCASSIVEIINERDEN